MANDSTENFIKSDPQGSIIIDFLLKELESMTTTMVVKLNYIARKYETTETRENGNRYVEAFFKMDVFESYLNYDGEVIENAGLGVGQRLNSGEIVTREMFGQFCTKPFMIPFEYRENVLNANRKYIVDNYEELNKYYRELYGLPPIDEPENEYVYVKRPIKDVDITKPVHKMTKTELIKLKVEGVLEKLIKAFPQKRYLNHLLDQKIEFANARKAGNYSILYLNRPSIHESLSDRFLAIYSQTINYVIDVIYDPAFSDGDQYYDAFIGMFILTITIQRFISNYFKSGIKKEFFNKDVIKLYLDSYGIPFYSDISLTYLTRIAKNLNMLLLFKATDQIFVDIFSLFGMKDATIYRYYLLKERKLDSNFDPIFAYKTIVDENGKEHQVEDLDKMWDLKFVSIPFNSKQLSVDILDSANYIDYNLIVEDDYLWCGDGDKADFHKKLLESEFNYVETKYISMTSKYDLTKLGFEMNYFFKMMYDLKIEEEQLIVTLPSGQHKLFNTFTSLLALSAKMMNFDGNIMETPAKTLKILGFNFKYDMEYVQNIINDIEAGKDVIIEQPPEVFMNPSEVVNLYFNNRSIYRTIIQKRANAKTIKEYNAYERLYKATMIADYSNEFYRLKNGKIAKTYVEYLEENDVYLYQFVKETNPDNLVENIELLLVGLDDFFKSDKFDNIFLNIPNLSLDSIKRFIYYLIDIFKSYTVDLVSMNVLYHMGDKYNECIKLLTESNPTADIEFIDKRKDGENRDHIRRGIWLKDKNEYPIPFLFYLNHYINLRDKSELSYSMSIQHYLNLFTTLIPATEFDGISSKSKGNAYHMTDSIEMETYIKEHKNNISLKDYIFIESTE